jgi:TolA-binding protein
MTARLPLARFVGAVLVLASVWPGPGRAQGQPAANAEADKLFRSAQEALGQKNFPLATSRFRDVVNRYAKTPSAAPAQFWLAVCLIDGHDKKYAEAKDLLQKTADQLDGKEVTAGQLRSYQGAAERGLGYNAMALAQTDAKNADKHRAEGRQHFSTAIKHFKAAFGWHFSKVQKWDPATKELSAEAEAAGLVLCDLVEVLLRSGDYDAAFRVSDDFMPTRKLQNAKVRDLGRYYHGFAAFMKRDWPEAEKALSMVAPFTDVRCGNHARYLLARLYHLNDERAEAAFHYDGVLADFNREKKEAQDLQRKPDLLAKDPQLKIRVDNLAKDPPPDHVIRTVFYSAVLLQESGRFGEARDRFQVFAKAPPGYPFATEALVRLGICQVQLKEAQVALNTLLPLAERDKALSDQVYLWLARAAAQLIPDPGQKAAHDKAVTRVIDYYQKAETHLLAQPDGDPGRKQRHGQLLLELADYLLQFHQAKQAVKVCTELAQKGLLPDRQPDVSYRLATALHLAGEHDASDAECERFFKAHADSLLLPALVFTYAENSALRTAAAEADPKQAANTKALRAETVKRYQRLIDTYPTFPRAQNARFAIAQLYYSDGDLAKAQTLLESIPPTDRAGDLAIVSYLLADCLLRQAPPGIPEDALAAGKLEALLKNGAELLDAFVSAQPSAPQAPQALLRQGQAIQRLASLQAQPAERNKLYQEARAAFEKVLQPQYAKHPLQPQALLERARCRVGYSGDLNKSMQELRQFLVDPLRQSAAAPLAVVQLGAWLRQQNKHAEAATTVANFAAEYRKRKTHDPAMVGLLAYHQGLALRDANQLPAARDAFAETMKLIPDQTEGLDAALRWAQCRKDQGTPALEQAKNLLASANPKDQQRGKQLLAEGLTSRQEAVAHLEKEIDRLKDRQPAPDALARMLYEAAWLYRDLGEQEVNAERARTLEAWQKKYGAKAAKMSPPEIGTADVPLPPSEAKARARYQALLEAFADAPISHDARLDLAELLAQRKEYDKAIGVLADALDREPPAEMTEKVRFLLGVCQAAKGNTKAALAQFDVVGQVPKSHLAAQAKFRAGECLMEAKQYAEAIKRFAVFRDVPQFHDLPGLSDRAVLRIGHAHAQLKQWDAARQAFEYVIRRYPGSRWIHEARFGLGWANEELQQWEPAANAYNQAAANAGVAEVGAKAQIRLGVCRGVQKKYKEAADAFLVVPGKYGYDEWSAVALLEAAEAFVQMKQVDQARTLLKRLIQEYAETPTAKTAKERLSKL